MREIVPRINGGAVNDERSPLKEAIDYCSYEFVFLQIDAHTG